MDYITKKGIDLSKISGFGPSLAPESMLNLLLESYDGPIYGIYVPSYVYKPIKVSPLEVNVTAGKITCIPTDTNAQTSAETIYSLPNFLHKTFATEYKEVFKSKEEAIDVLTAELYSRLEERTAEGTAVLKSHIRPDSIPKFQEQIRRNAITCVNTEIARLVKKKEELINKVYV